MTNKDSSNNTDFKLPSDWRGTVLSHIRILVKQANPEIIEEVKWKTTSNPNGVLVWSLDGMISTGEIYNKHLRLGLAKGNLLKDQDPKGLINTYRAIVIREGDKLDEEAFKNLILAAVELNQKNKKRI